MFLKSYHLLIVLSNKLVILLSVNSIIRSTLLFYNPLIVLTHQVLNPLIHSIIRSSVSNFNLLIVLSHVVLHPIIF